MKSFSLGHSFRPVSVQSSPHRVIRMHERENTAGADEKTTII